MIRITWNDYINGGSEINGIFHYYEGENSKDDKIIYLKNGDKHRLDGPAVIWFDNYKEYYIDNKEVTKEEQEFYCDLHKLKGIEND